MSWLLPLGLFVLALLPLIPGYLRMAEIGGAPAVIPENPRAIAMPVPVIVHVVAASVFYFLGALQFSAGIRRRWLDFHRWTGRAVAPFGMAVAVSGLWMTLFYPPGPLDHELLFALRLIFGSGMLAAIVLGIAAILRRDIPAHRAWMIRGYAIGLGAATQLFIFLPLLPFGAPGPLTNALLMGLGWGINLAVAEWIVRRPGGARAAVAAA